MQIKLKNKNGITLKTQGKFCKEDIVITPDFSTKGSFSLQDKEITQNGEYVADSGYDAFSKVSVNVPVPEGYLKPEGELKVTENGTYNVEDKQTVNVSIEGVNLGYTVSAIDYNGNEIKSAQLKSGQTFILPTPPEHERLIFKEWASPFPLEQLDDSTFVLTVQDQNVKVAPIYSTASGATEMDIILNAQTGLSVSVKNLLYATSIDWGDGTQTAGDGLAETVYAHEYENYGEYTVLIYGATEIGLTAGTESQIFGQTLSLPNWFLKRVFFGDSVKKIGYGAFKWCFLLNEITLPTTVEKIYSYAFERCFLETVILPPVSGLFSTVSQYVFNLNYRLKNLIVSYGITNLPYYFCGSTYALEEYVIPSSVKEFTSGYTHYCNYGMKKIYFPDSITSTGDYYCQNAYSLEEIRFSENLTTIGGYAFDNAWNLKEITFPSKLALIKTYAFENCVNVKRLEFPDKLETLQLRAFYRCRNLEYIKFGSNLTTIQSYTFQDCRKLKIMDFSQATKIPNLQNVNALDLTDPNGKIVVPDDLYDSWIVSTNWSSYAHRIVKASEIDLSDYQNGGES